MHSIFRYVYFFPEFGLKVPSKVADINHNSDQNLMVPLWKKIKKKKRVLISEYSFFLSHSRYWKILLQRLAVSVHSKL